MTYSLQCNANNRAEKNTAIKQCYTYFDQHLIQKARPFCEEAVALGDRQAELFLALLSFDDAAELNWYLQELKASDNHFYMSRIAYMYEMGLGTQKNYKKAVHWYMQAFEHKSKIASEPLGGIFLKGGSGIKADPKKSAYWYQLAAQQGDLIAFKRLGRFYSKGLGVEKNISLAKKWLQLAADEYDTQSMVLLGLILKSENNHESAIELWQHASKLHNAHAKFLLGRAYFNGKHLKKDYAHAIALFKISSQCGNPNSNEVPELHIHFCQQQAPYYLGQIYEHGKGVKIDIEKARRWYKQATRQGSIEALKALSGLISEDSVNQ
ncbi:hypothetical protein MNBD_GAMMA10-1945 [hydrothermal vent metagenome]|uniref:TETRATRICOPEPTIDE REPEAT FAMILY PROTEIN n=1 Tax=hydrothermal vent metagenome TaxID=652676 RepID=A0A3B0XW89_9ZZZZ